MTWGGGRLSGPEPVFLVAVPFGDSPATVAVPLGLTTVLLAVPFLLMNLKYSDQRQFYSLCPSSYLINEY